jgi:Tfp pilus assembly protein PilO
MMMKPMMVEMGWPIQPRVMMLVMVVLLVLMMLVLILAGMLTLLGLRLEEEEVEMQWIFSRDHYHPY